jgi:NIMA (never in mitosis gene a)-related kinase
MDEYEKIKLLGSGGYGYAYEVKKKSTGQIFCLKEINLNNSNGRIPVEDAKKEALFLFQLDHPNIVSLVDHFSNGEDFYYIVMEYVDGGDLASKIKNQKSQNIPFDESFIISVFAQLASALQECKKKKIIHRDLKTANILLSGSSIIKLGDFGISRSVDTLNPFSKQ